MQQGMAMREFYKRKQSGDNFLDDDDDDF